MKNSKVKAGRLSDGTSELAEDYEKELRNESKAKNARFIALGLDKGNRQFTKLSDEVAQSDHWVRNEPIKFGLDLFPPDRSLWQMRYSDLFYPNAKGGPLYIDTPGSSIEVMYCEQKLKAYQAKKVRYTYIKAHDDAADVLTRLDPMLPMGNGVTA